MEKHCLNKKGLLELKILDAKSQLITGVINQLHQEKEAITAINLATKLGITIHELKKFYKNVLKYEIVTYQIQCPLCNKNVCYHSSNGESIMFNQLGDPWEIHECCFHMKENIEELGLFDLSSLDFKSRIIKGAINKLYQDDKIPTEENIAKILNISIKEFRFIYKSVCRLSGNRIILKRQ